MLVWDDVDVDAGIALLRGHGDQRTKTRTPRWLAFTEETVRYLRKWRMVRAGKKRVFGEVDDRPRKQYNRMYLKFKRLTGRLKVFAGRNVVPQDLRRTVGSLAARMGVDQKVASEILGHSDTRTTARLYQNVDPETIRRNVLRLREGRTA